MNAAEGSVRIRRARVSREALSEYAIVFSFAALFLTLSIASGAFLTSTNLLNILDQWAPAGIAALGQTLVIIAGGFDLSVTAIFSVSGVIAAKVANSSGSAALGWFAGIGVGAGLGLINAILVTRIRINALIATLATGFAFSGFALVLTDGRLITVENTVFRDLGTNELLGIKFTVWIFAAAAIVAGIALARTNFGRYIYAEGGNKEAARLSGIRTELISSLTFVISGACAGLAGVLVASRIGGGQAGASTELALTTIAAVVLGGTSIQGGYGAIWRTVLGILILALIGNGFNLLGVNSTYQQIVTGAIILLAVGVDSWARRTT